MHLDEAIGAGAIYIGAVAEDSSGYPDCRPEYYDAFQELIRRGTRPETTIEIVTPVIRLKKSEIIRRGVELGAPLQLTWSCYQFEDGACGVWRNRPSAAANTNRNDEVSVNRDRP